MTAFRFFWMGMRDFLLALAFGLVWGCMGATGLVGAFSLS